VTISAASLAGLGLKGVLLAFWLSPILLTILVMGLGVHWRLFEMRSKFSSSLWKPLINYGLKLHLGSIFQSLNYRFDMYLVAFFLGSASVGWYSVSVAMAEWLWLLPSVLGGTLMQRLANTDKKEVNTISGPINRLTAGILLVGTFLLGFLGKWVIRLLYGETFTPSLLPFLLLLPGIWAMGLWKNFMNDLAMRGYPAFKSYTSGIALILTLGLDILLIPLWGIEGAALASSVAYISAFLIALKYYCKITGFHPLDLLIIRRSDISQLKTILGNGLEYLYAKSTARGNIKYFNK
jgi:O-antigen/teichoic acid export membrane protein